MKRQRGFTLIEIAIVLVIIGLLLGGVLKGQELIVNAKIKRINNDFNGIGAAVYSYLERYNALPGDDANANSRWGATNGDNDGLIDGAWTVAAPAVGTESCSAWDHLRRSNLIGGGSGITYPINAFGGRIGVQDTLMGMNGTVICMEDLEGKVAGIVDTQLDDSVPGGGTLRSAETPAATAPTETQYDLTKSYTTCKQI